jgi:hypothetical protein
MAGNELGYCLAARHQVGGLLSLPFDLVQISSVNGESGYHAASRFKDKLFRSHFTNKKTSKNLVYLFNHNRKLLKVVKKSKIENEFT